MSIFIDNAIGGWIRNAEQNGELEGNEFRGKKLDLEDYFKTPAEHRMGMKILKDANCLPPAIEIMKQIEEKKKELDGAVEEHQRELLKKVINSLELKRNLLLEQN